MADYIDSATVGGVNYDIFAKGGTLTSPLSVSGGDGTTAGKISLASNSGSGGQITDQGTSTLFGFIGSGTTTLTVGSTSYATNIRGSNVYINNSLVAYKTWTQGFSGTVGNTQTEAGVFLGLDTNPGAPNATMSIVSANTAAYIDFARPTTDPNDPIDFDFRIIKWNQSGNTNAQLQYGGNASGTITIPQFSGAARTMATTYDLGSYVATDGSSTMTGGLITPYIAAASSNSSAFNASNSNEFTFGIASGDTAYINYAARISNFTVPSKYYFGTGTNGTGERSGQLYAKEVNLGLGEQQGQLTIINNQGGQVNAIQALSTVTADTNDTNWRGRLIAGSKTKTFVMGVYKNLCGLGAHGWTDSIAGTDAVWEDLYINPSGTKAVYIGSDNDGWIENSGILKINNSDLKAYYNKGTAATPSWSEILTASDATTAATANKLVKRDSAGDINARWVNSEWLKTTQATDASDYTDIFVNKSGWLYKRAKASFTTDIGNGILKPTLVGTSTTQSNINGYPGAQFNVGDSDYNGLYIFTYGNCMILLPLYTPTAGTEYKIAAALVNSGGSYNNKVLTYRYTSTGYLQIYQKENYIPTGYTCAAYKIKLF